MSTAPLMATLIATSSVASSTVTSTASVAVTGIRGRVLDAKTKEPLIEASVVVVSREERSTLTDVDGNYLLELSPGVYDLRVFYELYQGRRISGVSVERAFEWIDVELLPDGAAVEEVVVEAKADTRKEAAVIQTRRRAAHVSDAVSAQEIARTPDSNASDAVKRVVSATVQGGKYVLVRGLGGRYVSALVNGVVLPSPEPDEQAVPLDLFPTSLLANLTILKTYGAELPGSFGGGSLQIETNSYPSNFEVKVDLSASGDSSTTFREQVGGSDGSAGFFGFASKTTPSSVPNDRPLAVAAGIDRSEVERIGEDFTNGFSAETGMGHPNLGLGILLGDTVRVFGRRFGYLGTLRFSHRNTSERAETGKAGIVEGAVVEREHLARTSGRTGGTLSALLNLGLELTSTDEINLFSLYTHAGESRTVEFAGYSETDGENIDTTRLELVERALSFTQLHGDHRFPSLANLEVDWQSNVSVAQREEPDTRDISYHVLSDGRVRLDQGPGSAEHFTSELLDLSGGASARLSLPLDFARFSIGGSAQRSSRSFVARRFRFEHRGDDPSVLYLGPDEAFTSEHIGPDFLLEEQTLPADTYAADLLVGAAFATADITLLDPFRVIAGVRVEHAAQTLEPGSRFAITTLVPRGVDRTTTQLLPAASLVYAITQGMNLRGAYSYTVARPQFRELAPFVYFDFGRRRNVSGNPELVDTRIHNADLRWEWFMGDSGLLAASAFYKRFSDPIEQIIYTTNNGDLTFTNARGADALGVELEARLSLGLVAEALESLRATANLTLLHSKIALDEEQRRAQTSLERPLQGQSPYVVNLGLVWSWAKTGTELGAFYNVAGERVAEVGIQGLPDVYERPFHRLDFTLSQSLGGGFSIKASATNVTNQAVVFEQGDVTLLEYRPGVAVMSSIQWAAN